MKIVSLKAENIKRLVAVEITPDGSAVQVIGGVNGAGKSSVLDAIMLALGGADVTPSKPVRTGEASGRVVLDLGDLTVTRRLTAAGGNTLIVANKEGARYPSPQAMLDRLIGTLSFDPLEFGAMKPKEQRETLRALVGLDTSDLDTAAEAVYADRAAVNRAVKIYEAQLVTMPVHEDAPAEEVSLVDLAQELTAAEASQKALHAARATHDERVRTATTEATRVSAAVTRVEQLRQELVVAEGALETARASHAEAVAATAEALHVGVAAKAALIDAAPIRQRVASAEGINAKVRANRQRAQLQATIDREKSAADAHTKALAQLESDKQARIAAAAFPVPGLGISAEGVTFNGEPFEQASQAERIRVSVAMGLALNPKLKVLLVRDGSLLDSKSMALLAELATAADAQVWVEVVKDSPDGVGIYIEDGAVREAEAVAS